MRTDRNRRRHIARRAGMTLVEVIVSIVILAGSALGLAAFVADFSRTVNIVRERERAGQAAVARLEEVKAGSPYDSLRVRYESTELAVPGYPGLRRETLVARVGGPGDEVDYVIVTVDVTSAQLATPVRKTTVISRF
jgi:prepilin-type N-terminal cleavage/methylation domain-containing protein